MQILLVVGAFEIDHRLKGESFVYFDFNKVDDIPEELFQNFDLVIVDPPFITKEVWEKYAKAVKLLLAENVTFWQYGSNCFFCSRSDTF